MSTGKIENGFRVLKYYITIITSFCLMMLVLNSFFTDKNTAQVFFSVMGLIFYVKSTEYLIR